MTWLWRNRRVEIELLVRQIEITLLECALVADVIAILAGICAVVLGCKGGNSYYIKGAIGASDKQAPPPSPP